MPRNRKRNIFKKKNYYAGILFQEIFRECEKKKTLFLPCRGLKKLNTAWLNNHNFMQIIKMTVIQLRQDSTGRKISEKR